MKLLDDSMKEECGVFGVFGCKDAARLTYLGLYALQHRGQEGAGIVSDEGSRFYVVKDHGLVNEIFHQDELSYLKGKSSIGHVRYSTTGSNNKNNIQPLFSKTSKGKIAIAHNGNLTNAGTLYKKMKKSGALFQSTVDSEVILHMLAKSKKRSIMGAMQETLAQIEGALSMVLLGEGFMMAARDPNGWRPLVLGRLGDGYVVASETCAFDLIGATYECEIDPGEIVYIDKKGVQSERIPVKHKKSMCIFEHVYFARPDSKVFGDSVHLVRKEMGRQLARQNKVEADMVMSIPDSGNSAALGYAEESGIPFEFGMTRNHYVGRTFIQPNQKNRDFSVRVKLNPIKETLEGKDVVVVDDSLVRGTTSKHRVKTIRDAGAKKIHMMISSPPITDPCFFGIDTPKKEKLAAATKTIDEIRRYIGADSLTFLDLDRMLDSVDAYGSTEFCTGCFTGKYPIRVRNKGKFAFESKAIKEYENKR